ncbi:NAD(P)-binding protein, partial [Jaminaea rosea]
MPARQRIVLFGASGFVGGSLLHALVSPPSSTFASVLAVTSSDAKAAQIEAWGRWIGASLETRVITSEHSWVAATPLAVEADLVIQAATSDDLKLTEAINVGLKQGRRGSLIHFSGVQLIESQPVGKYVETRLFNDLDLEALAAIPESAAHRSIDLSIVDAVTRGELYGSIVCPALVWGTGRGPCKRVSAQFPDLVAKALMNRSAVYVGEGTNRWTTVHIDDLVDLSMHLVHHHLIDQKSQHPPSAHSTFYFASHASSDQDFRSLARAVGEGLFDLGLLPSAD